MNIKELLDLNKKNMIICPSSYNEGIFKSIGNEFLYNLKFETPENFVKEVLGSYLQRLVMMLEEGVDKDFGPLNVSGAQELINISPFFNNLSSLPNFLLLTAFPPEIVSSIYLLICKPRLMANLSISYL